MVQCADDSEGNTEEEHEAQHLEVSGGEAGVRWGRGGWGEESSIEGGAEKGRGLE